jgi:hypothetical protein
MELLGAAQGVILNEPQLCERLIRDSERDRSPRPILERSSWIFRRLALAMHGLASRIDPAVRVSELIYSGSPRKPVNAGELP